MNLPSPRIVLLGSTGQLGQYLAWKLRGLGECITLGRSDCDLSTPENIRPFLRSLKPNVIVNVAALAAVDKAETERELAFALNARLPQILGEEAEEQGSLVIHYSTDYVFDGKKSIPYVETDSPNPINVYGESKLAGEQALQKVTEKVLIARISWLVSSVPQNFVPSTIAKAYRGEPIVAYADQYGVPTPDWIACDMAEKSIQKFFSEPENLSFGLYHVTPKEYCSRYEQIIFLLSEVQKLRSLLDIDSAKVQPGLLASLQLPARRPLFSALASDKYEKDFRVALPSWKLATQKIIPDIIKRSGIPGPWNEPLQTNRAS